VNAQLKSVPTFARETCDTVVDEIEALMEAHYAEVNHHPDIPPGCDYDKYRKAESLGILRIFTVRVGGALVGYSIFMVGFSLHYKTSFQARQDTLFIHPDYRRGLTGYRFLHYVDDYLRADGVQVAYQHHKVLEGDRLNLGPLFERMGYQLIYKMYFRRLDQC
jgi:GNAT superfamily N-acetyltransferase